MFLLSVTTVRKILIPKGRDPGIPGLAKIQSRNPGIGKVTGIVTPKYEWFPCRPA